MFDDYSRTAESRRPAGTASRPSPVGWFAALALVIVLAGLGLANVYVRATWHEFEDGVLWLARPHGVTAVELADRAAAGRAGVRAGDVLLAIDGQPVDSPADVALAARRAGAATPLTYTLLRLGAREIVEVRLTHVPQGNSVLYFILAAVGIFTLLVGAWVRLLGRPADPSSWHLFWLSVAFFGVFTFSFSGKLDRLDWLFYWADAAALLALGPLLLHFALVFPERAGSWARSPLGSRLLPLVYLPSLVMLTARVLAITGMGGRAGLVRVVAWLDRVEPLYLGACLLTALAVLGHATSRVKSVTARRQVRWILGGTLVGGAPFTLGYALPFALGATPSVQLELLAVPLGLIPLAFASAIVRYRLWDVEVIIKRGLVYTAAAAGAVALYGILLKAAGWAFPNGPANAVVAVLATLVVVLLARPMKDVAQNMLDRALYRDRYDYRRALVGFARDLSTDLDLGRLSERLVARISETLVVDRIALMVADEASGAFRPIRSVGFVGEPPAMRLDGGVGGRARGGHAVALDDPASARRAGAEDVEDWRGRGVHYVVPCVSKQTTVAVLALGRKERGEPLSSEDMALLLAVAAQVGTAIENGRLYEQLRAQADQVERMRQSNENILESLGNGLAVVDAGDRVVRWNRALERLTGVRRAEAAGRGLGELLGAPLVEGLASVRRANPAGAALYRVPLQPHPRARHDKGLLVNVVAVPLEPDPAGAEQADGWVVVFEDVTTRARLEEQLQISDKMASIGLLAAGVAHEVNTPLTGISSYTQMLLDRADPDDPQTKLLEKIERQTFRAAKIVNGLLTLARGGRSGDERVPVDLNAVVSDVLSLLEHQLKAVNIQIRRDLDAAAPVVHGVEHKLQQVFLNLFINARDAMPRGGWLSVATRAEGERVRVEVADTGAGIPQEHLARIYDPFFTTKGLGQGTGLGLSITYGIVGEHDGTIACDSRPGEGTRFTLTFPPAPSAQQRAAAGGIPVGG
ncbi:MAG TPA: ATP-binding protein [Vicinamibacterales bacterium]|nr:ATP-binding protein [Vicinamibacterales bacterium]HPW19669.1 ATP-binding protein [Vicinamibacterales bacterium]